MKRELGRFRTSSRSDLLAITRRFPAIDARDGRAVAATADVDPNYRIGDQLYVQPDDRLADAFASDEPVRMTRQEVAVARSHIEVWKIIAAGSDDFSLVLEDDAWFKLGARKLIERGWRDAVSQFSSNQNLLYFSYEDANATAVRESVCDTLFRPVRGLWHLSGYVLSREGAAALLRAMPVIGPVDLWMNYRFAELDVLALDSPAIAQRTDARSDNAYSVMPYLARAGVVDAKHRARPPDAGSPVRVLAWSEESEHEGLAMALAMLGLRVRVFDDHEDPLDDRGLLDVFGTFDALVNPPVASSSLDVVSRDMRVSIVVEADAKAPLMIGTVASPAPRSITLVRSSASERIWDELCAHLGVVKPAQSYPLGAHKDFRLFRDGRSPATRDLVTERPQHPPMDDSPWVLPPPHRWRSPSPGGYGFDADSRSIVEASMTEPSPSFPALNETFPGNLASFAPENLRYSDDGVELILNRSPDAIRPFGSGAFASARQFPHGRFQAEIRAAAGAGLITGFFLHRSSPRQEIDIEFAGSDPRRMLTNVYFNPGDDGASMDYGYRGSPCWIDLGFDSTDGFHEYAIDWRSDRVTWLVDGRVVHERASWDPTPVPHLELRLHANLWAPRSRELAGRVSQRSLPASAAFRNVVVSE
jgi:GR25 family glycosyltransferase involved in LPS biosynthesis